MSEIGLETLNKSRVALNFVFASMGLAIMSAATRYAEIKEMAGVGDAVFGYALAAGTIGGLTGNFLSHRFIHALGNNLVIRIFGFIMMTSVAMQSFASSAGFIAVCAAASAFGYSTMNVAVNAAGVEVEIALNRSVMPMFHASWSMGALATSLVGNIVAGFVTPKVHLFSIWAIALFSLLVSIQQVTDPNKDLPKPDRNAPVSWQTRKILLGISIASALGMMAEGTSYNWSAIYFHEVIGLPIGPNSLGLTAFLLAQITGRVLVGRLNDKYGLHKVIRTSAALGGTAYLAILIINSQLISVESYRGSAVALVISMFGFVCVGLGVAALPAGYMAGAGRVAGIATTRAISIVAVTNTSLALIFQPIISTIVGSFGLSIALMVAAVALLVSAYRSKVLAPTSAL